ncbi:hypothetical protein BJV78DRAFT_597483 [Lactifluus subvellereus]|nr:hypothetical protein BJV78DRAFT_597483 [Lactifluus subvellereus]
MQRQGLIPRRSCRPALKPRSTLCPPTPIHGRALPPLYPMPLENVLHGRRNKGPDRIVSGASHGVYCSRRVPTEVVSDADLTTSTVSRKTVVPYRITSTTEIMITLPSFSIYGILQRRPSAVVGAHGFQECILSGSSASGRNRPSSCPTACGLFHKSVDDTQTLPEHCWQRDMAMGHTTTHSQAPTDHICGTLAVPTTSESP